MRKGALLLAVLMAATAPTAALAKKKTKAPKKPAVYSTTPANSNESSARIVRDGITQIFVPLQPASWAPPAAKK
ncbi:MAG: hypothetical protein AB7K04_14165 [Pseudorhodoplanes sp.]